MKKIVSMLLLGLTTLIYAENISNQKSWGVEINPFRVAISAGGSEWKSFSGTISHFNNQTGVEIAIPILYTKDISTRSDYMGLNGFDDLEDESIAVDIDIHYRQYFSKKRTDGVYMGLFGRYTYLDGKAIKDGKYATVEKFGVGGEIGFRFKNIYNTPLYWGASFALGAYLGSDNDVFDTTDMGIGAFDIDDNRYIVDLELLKVGYEF